MKLSDIFNLPKNAQGNKLFKKIINKYGLSKEDYKALKNIKVGEDDFPTSKYIYLKADITYGEMGNIDFTDPLRILYILWSFGEYDDNESTDDGIICNPDVFDILYKLDNNGEIIYTKDAYIYDDNISIKGMCITQYVQSNFVVSGTLKYHKNIFTDIRNIIMIHDRVSITKEEIDKFFKENAISAEEFWDNAEIVKYV